MCGRDDPDGRPSKPTLFGPPTVNPTGGNKDPDPGDHRGLFFAPLVLAIVALACGGGSTSGGKTEREKTPYGDRYPEGKRGPIHRGGVGGVTQGEEKRYGRKWLGFARLRGGRRVWA